MSIPRITINEYGRVVDSYQELIDEINAQYRNYPTSLVEIPLSEEEKMDMIYYTALGEHCTVGSPTGGKGPA